MAVLNLVFGLVLGPVLGGFGVAVGAMAALTIASYFLIIKFHNNHDIGVTNIVPAEHYVLLVAIVFGAGISFVITRQNFQNVNFMFAQLMGLGIFTATVAVAMFIHPYKKLLIQAINVRRMKSQLSN